MRYTLHLTAILLLTGLTSSGASGQSRPYAPKAPLPDSRVTDSFMLMEIRSVEAAEVPDRSEVEAPPYPNAVIVRTIPTTTKSSGGDSFNALPVVVLVTADSLPDVLEYYRENLVGWNQAEILSTFHFWPGDEDFHPLKKSGQVTPSVEVRQARASKLVPDAQTAIHVRYKPGGGLHIFGQPRAPLAATAPSSRHAGP